MKEYTLICGPAADDRAISINIEAAGDGIILPAHLRHAASELLKQIGFPEVAHCLADEIARRNRYAWPLKPYGKPLEATPSTMLEGTAERLKARG